jgi:hypothetical protein
MSNFDFGMISMNENRIGVWIRIQSPYCEDIRDAIKKSKLVRKGDMIERVIVRDINESGALLEVWARLLLDSMRHKLRHNVFYIRIKENPEWTCDGDLGTGFKE